MGTYTQPSQIIDKSHSQINKGLSDVNTNILSQMQANRKSALEQQKAIEKAKREQIKNEAKRQRDISDLEAKQRKAGLNVVHSVNGNLVGEDESYTNVRSDQGKILRVKKSNVDKALDLRNRSLEGEDTSAELAKLQEETSFDVMSVEDDDFGGIQFGIEQDLKYLYGELANYETNTKEYEFTVGLINQVLDESPVLVDLVNKTAGNQAKGWNLNGEILEQKKGISGIVLEDGAPNFELRKEAARHIIFGTKQGRFSYESVGNDPNQGGQFSGSSYILYTAENGEQLKIGYKEYKELVENGGGIVGTTQAEPYDKAIKSIWDQNKANYDSLKTKSSNSSTDTKGDRKVTVRKTIQGFENANENLEKSIEEFVFNGGMNNVEGKLPGYNYAQNLWQMAGGKGQWKNTVEQKQSLANYLTEDVKRKYGSETNITTYNVSNREYKSNQEQESTAILTEGLLLDAEISEKYFKSKNSLDNNNKAEYGYQDIRDNYKTLSNNGFRGAAAMLTDLDTSNKKTYRSGADMNTQLIKDNNYKLLDENGNPVMQADPSKLYVDIGNNNTYLELNVTDFPSLINEVKNARGTKKEVHEKAIKKINTETPIDETSEVKKGDEEQFNEIEIANQLS